jgi:hypothetical protein
LNIDDLPWASGNRQRYIVCAANKTADGTLVLGARHYDSVMHDTIDRLKLKRSHNPDDQGFIDQYGVFLSRTEAWKVAFYAGQIRFRCGGDTANGGTLYSENLY